MKCRHCFKQLENTFLDLGFAPPSNSYLTEKNLNEPEIYFPLKLKVCKKCWLVQTEDYAKADDLFNKEYAYFSSISKSWLKHSLDYFNLVRKKFLLSRNSFIIEIASNDGYLLKNFIANNIPCLGIEPTISTATVAEKIGIPVIKEFFSLALSERLVKEKKSADLIIGNNVYAHVPDINDFTQGLKKLLKPNGVITLEFPHLMKLIRYSQFDTVYHEHFSYFSLITVANIFKNAGLRIWDVEELETHGGSLRVYGCHEKNTRETSNSVFRIIEDEKKEGILDIATYKKFQVSAELLKNNLVSFLLDQKKLGKSVVAYGAAAKGNTILNFAGVKSDLISFVCDAAPSKQGKFMPGSHIPIFSPDKLKKKKPNFILILPWNISSEVIELNSYVKKWGAKFVVAVPELKIIE